MANALPIFVSHSHEDAAFCQALVTALRGAGADVWYDEHNLGAGHLMDVIQQELDRRKIFIVILSKRAFASKWVKRETGWAYSLYDRDPTRVILPVTAATIERDDFSGATGWLYLEEFKRIEAPGYQPYPQAEAVGRVLHALALTPAGEAPAPTAPQPSESVDDLLTKGKALMAQHKVTEPMRFFERATEIDPNNFDAWANLGRLYLWDGQTQRGLDAIDRALTLRDNDPYIWFYRGQSMFGLQRYEEALASFDHALALNLEAEEAPKHPFSRVYLWYHKAIAYEKLQRYEEALDAYDRQLASDDHYRVDNRLWFGKGRALISLRRYKEALEAIENASRGLFLYPGADKLELEYYRDRAIALRGLGRTREAKEAEARAKALGG